MTRAPRPSVVKRTVSVTGCSPHGSDASHRNSACRPLPSRATIWPAISGAPPAARKSLNAPVSSAGIAAARVSLSACPPVKPIKWVEVFRYIM